MLKPQRPTAIRDRERVDFKFSNFQALQVPKTWDRLFVSILSVETGKTVAKLGKALVKNGSCQWTETVSESVYVTRDEECLVKLLVSTGSARSSALGEAIINVTQYARVSSSTVSQALKKCSYGTTLQLKVQCTVVRSRTSDEQSKYSNSQENDDDDDGNENGSKSRSQRAIDASDPHRSENHQEISNSESDPDNNSFHSTGNSVERKSIKSEEYNSYEQRGSFEASPVHYDGSVHNDSLSNQSPSHSLTYRREDSLLRRKRNVKRSSANSNENTGSSRNLLEAAEETIEELRAEAKMWERNARKLMIDLDMSRRELQNVSKKHADLEMELKASHAEVEGLKRDLHDSTKEKEKKEMEEDNVAQCDNLLQMQKVWESEVKYQQDLNASLSRQLRSSQDSNVELVSVLHELEETIEQQKFEIQKLSSVSKEFKELEASIARDSEENSRFLAQLQESEKKLRNDYQLLERDKAEVEDDNRSKLSVKEEEVSRLEAKFNGGHGKNDVDLVREIDSLREKIDELEKDCAELTDENLELILKLKDFKNTDTSSNEHHTVSSSNESEVSDPKFFFHLGGETKDEMKEAMQRSKYEISEEHIREIVKELRVAFDLVKRPFITATSDENLVSDDLNGAIDRNTINEMSVEYVLTSLLELNKLLETRIVHYDKLVHDRDIEVEERSKIIDEIQKDLEERVLEIGECEKTKKEVQERYEDLLKEMDRMKSQLVHMELQRTEVERKSKELENTLSMLQEENVQLQVIISGLESTVQELKQENDVSAKETDHFKNVATGLEEEIRKLKNEWESQVLDLQSKTEDLSKRCLGAQEHCERLELENKKLQESAASFERETEDLRSLNSKLNQQNEELQKQQFSLANQLTDFCKKMEILEDQLTMLREEFAESERRFQSEVDTLVEQNSKHDEKLALDESLHQEFSVKEREIEKLQKEMVHLNRKICAALEEKERISMEYSSVMSQLTAEKQALEASLQEVREKSEIELQESDSKVQDLNEQLVSSTQNHVELIAEHERVLKMLAHYKRSEEKHKTAQNDLELKITICDYERQQLSKEIGILKEQLQSIPGLRDQISLLKSELEGCMLERKRLDLALQKMSGAHELTKTENISFSEKISSLQGVIDELEECKKKTTALKEKLHEMEDELAKKSILGAENADLRDELDELKRGNVQFQQKMYMLEEEKDECWKKVQVLGESLKAMEERYNSLKESSYKESQGESPFPVSTEHIIKHTLPDEKSTCDHGFVARARYERTKSSLETELRDLRERYLEMSLKYAEVEAEREDLVMKLKASKSGKRWFS